MTANLIADFSDETFIICLATRLCIERSSIQKNATLYTTGDFFVESLLEPNRDDFACAHIKFCGVLKQLRFQKLSQCQVLHCIIIP
jgi:hypothetical protein